MFHGRVVTTDAHASCEGVRAYSLAQFLRLRKVCAEAVLCRYRHGVYWPNRTEYSFGLAINTVHVTVDEKG